MVSKPPEGAEVVWVHPQSELVSVSVCVRAYCNISIVLYIGIKFSL